MNSLLFFDDVEGPEMAPSPITHHDIESDSTIENVAANYEKELFYYDILEEEFEGVLFGHITTYTIILKAIDKRNSM
ncbi:2717_t:CDS:2 [Funneliformis mosseae]|uniref:2717_t:CDS:1 n=1 Tax=Funneliformis mosseae TaxID=27381 RepID=A0A9N9GBS8_FUNMO|nr:2717_t:CDS:2 [Funneliformis mosseae]